MVVDSPRFDLRLRVRDRGELVHVQALVAEPSLRSSPSCAQPAAGVFRSSARAPACMQCRVTASHEEPACRAGTAPPRRRADDHGLHETHATGRSAGFGNAQRRGRVKKGFRGLPQGNEISGRKPPRNHRGGPNGIRFRVYFRYSTKTYLHRSQPSGFRSRSGCLLEVKTVGHAIGSAVSRVEMRKAEYSLAELHKAYMRV
jgi:hypothetical protein